MTFLAPQVKGNNFLLHRHALVMAEPPNISETYAAGAASDTNGDNNNNNNNSNKNSTDDSINIVTHRALPVRRHLVVHSAARFH